MKRYNFPMVIRLMGLLIFFNSLFMLATAIVGFCYDDTAYLGIFKVFGVLSSVGVVTLLLTKSCKREIKKNEGFLVATLGWFIIALSGAMPFIMTGTLPHFADAFFESMSGYSTTGATLFNDIESLPESILLWRSITHWIGGMGIIVLAIAVLPLLGVGGMQLFMAEAPGPGADKLSPRISDTAKRLWIIYASLTLAESLLLTLEGMSFFDAVNHAMASISCGGFSTKNASLAHWNDNPIIGYTMIGFMCLAGTNFVLIYYVVKGRFKKLFRDDEYRFYLGFLFAVITLVSISIYTNAGPTPSDYDPMPWGVGEANIRQAAFQVISIVTSTGFITSDYTAWTPFISVIFFGLLFAGGCSGSTSGGIKMVRHLMMIKNGWLEFKRSLHPNAIIFARFNNSVISGKGVYNIMAFFILYLITFIIGALILGFSGLDTLSALSVSASSLANAGPALGDFGPLDNFSALNDLGKYCCSMLMMTGRLEVLTVLILLSPHYWKRR